MVEALGVSLWFSLVSEFISPPKVYTFSFIVGDLIPKSLKCIHSATKSGVWVSAPVETPKQPTIRLLGFVSGV